MTSEHQLQAELRTTHDDEQIDQLLKANWSWVTGDLVTRALGSARAHQVIHRRLQRMDEERHA